MPGNAAKERGPPSPQQVAGTPAWDHSRQQTLAEKRAVAPEPKLKGKAVPPMLRGSAAGSNRVKRAAGCPEGEQNEATPALRQKCWRRGVCAAAFKHGLGQDEFSAFGNLFGKTLPIKKVLHGEHIF